ncbi:hypothetical protein MHPYR_50126 [uncultured Mycobacterium sp.]|uniref:Uncharacterized protein n=1 Tax=uncultured Mycobacterium sp. TaxID=171292 RepID=A0A1Y5PKU7_9MYCO|nr:hypothetical protein MHPYR_50126 [uncultured Mycobacterium sp.]
MTPTCGPMSMTTPHAGRRGCGAAISGPSIGRRSPTRRCWRRPSPNWPSTWTASRPAARCCVLRSTDRETALLFARLGAEVVVSDLNEAGVTKTAADITGCGGPAETGRGRVRQARRRWPRRSSRVRSSSSPSYR